MSEPTEETTEQNDQLIAIVGLSTSGKSASLRNIVNQDRWIYLNCEAGKRLPFKNKFNTVTITDPYDVYSYFQECIDNSENVDGIVIDSLTFLMDMFETTYVIGSPNTMAGWSAYGQFLKKLMQYYVPLFNKPVIVIAHVKEELDEAKMEMRSAIPVKGAAKNVGVEAYFTTVVATKKVPVKELEKYDNKLLVISEEERELGYKHVFQTRLTKNTTGERLRSPMGMFTKEQTYMDNDAQQLLDHLGKFYKD